MPQSLQLTTRETNNMKVTADIADAFDTSFEEAERLKLTYGQAQVKTLVPPFCVPLNHTNQYFSQYF
jgi:hypothetical protein